MRSFFVPLLILMGLLLDAQAYAQPSDPLPPTDEEAIDTVLSEAPKLRRKLVKVLQPKHMLKSDRLEFGPHLGLVTNNPYIHRTMVGIHTTWHATEVLGVELRGTFSPDFGRADWTDLTQQLIENNRVSPDISKLIWHSTLGLQFSPIHGKLAIGRRIISLDLFGTSSIGLARTHDNLEVLGCEGESHCTASEKQIHPTVSLGGGARISLTPTTAFRVEARSISYIETIQSKDLEAKNNLAVFACLSFFTPPRNAKRFRKPRD